MKIVGLPFKHVIALHDNLLFIKCYLIYYMCTESKIIKPGLTIIILDLLLKLNIKAGNSLYSLPKVEDCDEIAFSFHIHFFPLMSSIHKNSSKEYKTAEITTFVIKKTRATKSHIFS